MSGVPRVGIIGLGLVGKALAKRFLNDGSVVSGYDVDAVANDGARSLGVGVVSDPRELAMLCQVVVLSLPHPDAISDALWGPRGIASVCQAGSILLDTSTTDPEASKAHWARLDVLGIRFVDVCLVGASDMIERGEALALVGDTEAAAAPYRTALQTISDTRFFLGAPGAGNSAKLAVNLVQGLNRLVLAEGLALGKKSGLDAAQLLSIFKASAAYSRVMDIKGRRMLEGDYEPVARLRQHAKDVALILEAAERCGAITPLSVVHAEILRRAMASGWGNLDNSAVMKVYEAGP